MQSDIADTSLIRPCEFVVQWHTFLRLKWCRIGWKRIPGHGSSIPPFGGVYGTQRQDGLYRGVSCLNGGQRLGSWCFLESHTAI